MYKAINIINYVHIYFQMNYIRGWLPLNISLVPNNILRYLQLITFFWQLRIVTFFISVHLDLQYISTTLRHSKSFSDWILIFFCFFLSDNVWAIFFIYVALDFAESFSLFLADLAV